MWSTEQAPPQIPQVNLEHVVGRGSASIVYRASRGMDTVAVKVPDRGDELTEAERRRFLRRGALLATIDHPVLPGIIEVDETDEGLPYIVRDYVRGQTLRELVDTSGPLTPARIAELGRWLADVLTAIHQKGLIHRALVPATILMGTDDRPRLVGFGTAVDEADTDQRQRTEMTVPWTAPEQSGAIDGLVDVRSDLYSLGAVLYFAATGRPPYDASDLEQLRALQIETLVSPVAEANRKLDARVADVIDELLMRQPADRPGSSRRLVSRFAPDSEGDVNPVSVAGVGGDDLVGRHNEYNQLIGAWRRARQESMSFAFVEGATGSGKSVLVDALVDRIRDNGAVGLSVSLRERSPHPFWALRRLFDPLFEAFEQGEKTWRDEFRSLVDEVLENRPEAVVRALPRLAEIGSYPVDDEVRTFDQGASRLVYESIADLLVRVAGRRGGMVVALDDVRWLDEATERVVERLATIDETVPLLVVMTVDAAVDDAGRSTRLRRLVADRTEADIECAPFDRSDVDALIEHRLGAESVDGVVGRTLCDISDGNAYGVEIGLDLMLDAPVLRLRPNRWSLDETAFEDFDLPEDVGQLFERRLDELRASTRDLLAWVALFDTAPDSSRLAACAGVAPASLDNAFREAIRAGVVDADAPGKWSLVHGELGRRLRNRLDDDERRRRHQQIARIIDAEGSTGDEELFELARHYGLGEPGETPRRAVTINHRAGRRARRHFAFQRALSFLRRAAEIAESHGVTERRELYTDLGLTAEHTGDLNLADRYLSRALQRTSDPLERARLRTARTNQFVSNLEYVRARSELKAAFAEIDRALPKERLSDALVTLGRWIRSELTPRLAGNARPGYWLDPPLDDRRFDLLMDLGSIGARVAHHGFDAGLFVQLAVAQHDLAVRYRDPAALARTHTTLGYIAAEADLEPLAESHRQKAREYRRRAPSDALVANTVMLDAMIQQRLGDPFESHQQMVRLVTERGERLDIWEYVTAVTVVIQQMSTAGRHRRATEVARKALRELELRRESGEGRSNRFLKVPVKAMVLPSLAAVGDDETRKRFLDRCLKYLEETDHQLYHHAVVYSNLIGHDVEVGRLDAETDKYLERFETLPFSRDETPFYLRVAYIWNAWLELRRAERDRRSDGEASNLEALVSAIDKLDEVAVGPTHGAFLELFSAGMARLEGRLDEAETRLEAARRTADEVGMPVVGFEIAVQRAEIHRHRDQPEVAARYLRQARRMARNRDWEQRLRNLRTVFGDIPSGSVTDIDEKSPRTGTTGSHSRREVSMRIAGLVDELTRPEPNLDEILQTTASTVDASRGLYLVVDDDGENLHPEATTDGEDHLARGVVDQALATGRPLIISTVEEGRRWDRAAFGAEGIKSALAVPVELRGRTRDIVYFESRDAEGVFSPADVEPIETAGRLLGLAREMRRVQHLERRVQEADQQGETLLEHATRAVGIGLAILTPDEELRSTNPVVDSLAEPWGALSEWWTQVRPGGGWDETRQCDRCGRLEFSGRTLADVETPGGTRLVFELTSTGHGHELTDEPSDHLVLVTDATRRVETREELEEINDELVEARDEAMAASRAKSAFLANMSHELRTPLNAIIGYSEMLLEETDRESQLNADLRRIQVSGRHLLELVNELLNLSKIETGRIEVDAEPIELPQMIEDIVDTARQPVEEKNNDFIVDDPPDVELINDETKLRQILINLIGNAAKFTEDGTIRLEIDWIDRSDAPDGPLVEFAVVDTGIGMTEQEQESLFEAFYQVEPGALTEEGGTGLGLTIARQFCEHMGGEITVDSQPGVGSTFTVRFPADIEATSGIDETDQSR